MIFVTVALVTIALALADVMTDIRVIRGRADVAVRAHRLLRSVQLSACLAALWLVAGILRRTLQARFLLIDLTRR